MSVQWFPGHMARAKRQVQDNLKLVDVAIELLDARLPKSSRNPMVDEILGPKPRLIILNKADLADPVLTNRWQTALSRTGAKVIQVDAIKGKGTKEIAPAATALVADKLARLAALGRRPRAVRCMVLGIPNVGKSSLINKLVGQKATRTGDLPGVTRGQQWVRIGQNLELLDTPGILWPKFEDREVGFKLAMVGSVKEQVYDLMDIAVRLLGWLMEQKPRAIMERYKITQLPEEKDCLLDVIGRRRGLLLSGGRVDEEKVAILVLKEFREGLLGRYTLDLPE